MDVPEINDNEIIIDETDKIIEAIIAASDKPVDPKILIEVIKDNRYNNGKVTKTNLEADLQNSILRINTRYKGMENSFRIEQISGGYRLLTLSEFDHYIRKYLLPIKQQRLSKAALETLAVIAYRQPVVRSEIERIRGVASDGVMRTLLDRKLVKIAGRATTAGKPLLYTTTDIFLEYFGLNDITELPGEKEIEMLIGKSEKPSQTGLTLKREPEEDKIESTENMSDDDEENPEQVDSDRGIPETIDEVLKSISPKSEIIPEESN
ncbi:MAG: SMC-Scp complex subunit ScpB [candidate division Zixibacteria bacterium]|nr:SMC-Scp complex subunit ScpB [candidate division Zixibacteria bacterium]